MPMFLCVDVGEHGPRVRIVGFDQDGALEAVAHPGVLLGLEKPLMIIVAKDAIVGRKRRRRLVLRFGLSGFRDHAIVAGEDCRHLVRNIFLDCKNVGWRNLSAIGVRPYDSAGLRVYQTGQNFDLVLVASNAADQQIIDTELPSKGLRIGQVFLVIRRGLHRQNEQCPESGEIRNDLVGNTLGKIGLFGIVAQTSEGQHGDLGSSRQFRRRAFAAVGPPR